jgi:hypothetical protein
MMSDEQIVYISPEDDLTNVRERLGRVTSKKVTLVVPNHSQLRSHVAWKLLYSRARDLEKEVLIVSSDPQIRSVALAVNFKVATSLEAAASGKSKQVSRPGRPTGSRGRSNPSSARSTGKNERRSGVLRSTRHPTPPASSQGMTSKAVRPAEKTPKSPPSQPIYGPPTTYPGSSTPPIQPLSPEQLDEEPDLLMEDFNQAQNIRQAAMGKPSQPARQPQTRPSVPEDPFLLMDDSLPPPSLKEQHGSVPRESFATSDYTIQDMAEDVEDDYFSGAGTISSPQTPRPHGWVEPSPEDEQDLVGPANPRSVRPQRVRKPPAAQPPRRELRETFLGGEDDLPPIEDRPTQVTPPLQIPKEPSRELAGPAAQKSQPVGDKSRPLDIGTRPPASTQGKRSRPLDVTAQQGLKSHPLDASTMGRRSRPLDATAQPGRKSRPLEGTPQPSSTGRKSRPLEGAPHPSSTGRKSRPLEPRSNVATPASQRPRSASRFAPPVTRQAVPSRVPRRSASETNNRWVYLLAMAAIVILLAVGGLVAAGPSADVALTLRTKAYTHDLTIVAQDSKAPDAILVQTQKKTFSKDGTVTATDTKKVGTEPARGFVTFKNSGTQAAIVPTGTNVATASGIQFRTEAEPSVLPGNSSGPVPVVAVQPGEAGNVAGNSITLIPDPSKTTIARASNIQPGDLKLTVTNEDITRGGGVGNKSAAKKSDIDSASKALHDDLQKDIDTWTKQLAASGVAGTPSQTEQLLNAPEEGKPLDDAKVPVTLNITVTVLYVTNEALQHAAITQLNDFMRKDKGFENARVLEPQGKSAVKLEPTKAPTGDAKSMTMNFKASTLAIPNLTENDVRSKIAGHTVSDATTALSQLPNVQKVDIKPWPGPVFWLPWWGNRIKVEFIAGAAPPEQPKQ